MDYEIFHDLDITTIHYLFQHCSWLALVENHFPSAPVIHEGQIIPAMTMSSDSAMGIRFYHSLSLRQFIQKHRIDLKEWLYVSKDMCNIYQIKAKYFMNCCFVNEGYNDIMQLSHIHEIRHFDEIVKILR